MAYTVTVDKDKCNGDGLCVDNCPGQVLELVEGKAEPVNMDDCLGCQSCMEVCTTGAITVTED
ncbi:MAG: 4Fe-4S binding protein [Thermodesulfobacteriota bacterium]